MHVREIGDLYLYDILLSYIYPRVFVCEDDFDCKYLFYEISSTEDLDTWAVTKITTKEYYALVDRIVPIQKVYKKTGFNTFTISKKYNDDGDEINLSLDVKDSLAKLPKIPVFSEKQLLDDVVQETLNVARQTGETTVDIVLFPGTDRHSIPQKVMSDLCDAVNTMTYSVFGRRKSEAVSVATATGSCIVRFTFPDQINLFSESDAVNELNVINHILASESCSEELENIYDKTKFVNSYSKLLGAIKRTNSDVQFTTASPNSNEVQRIDLSSSTVSRRYNEVKDIRKIETEEISMECTLIAIDIKTRKAKFKTNEGTIISSSVLSEIIENESFEIPKAYSVTFCVDSYVNIKSEKKKQYRLIRLLG